MEKKLKVEDLMDRVFVTFNPKTTVQDAIDILGKKKLFEACVTDGDGNILGILSEEKCEALLQDEKELKRGRSKSIADATVMDVINAEFKSLQKTTGIREAARILLSTDYRRMPVVETGKIVGQITRRDLIRAIESIGI